MRVTGSTLISLLTVLLFSGGCAVQQPIAQVPLAPEAKVHWLIGQWEGTISGFRDRPGRMLRVNWVSTDGKADARWAITGERPDIADVEVRGSRVKIVTAADSVVDLTRRGDTSLVGTFTLKTGRSYPINLAKAIAANDLPRFEPTPASRQYAIGTGRGREYLAAMEALAMEAERKQRWDEASMTYSQASGAAITLGELQKCISFATKAVEFAQRANNPYYEATGMLYLADAFKSVGQPQKEREWVQKALTTLDRMDRGENRDLTEARLYLYLGRNYLRQGETQQAIEYLAHSVALYDARLSFLKSRRVNLQSAVQYAQMMTVYCLDSLGRAYLQAGNSPEAIKVLERGLAIESASGLEASLSESLGRAYLAQKDSPRAIEYLTRALRTADAQQQAWIVARASSEIGQFLMQTGKSSEAVPYYKKAIDSIESRRSVLESEDMRTSFFENTVNTYANMIRAQLAHKNLGDAFNYSERARSRTFLDVLGSKVQLARSGTLMEHERALQARISVLRAMMAGEGSNSTQTSELRKQLAEAQQDYNEFLAKVRKENKEQASLMNVEPLTVTQVQERLDPDVTMLEYFVTDTTVLLWVVEKERVEFVSASIARKDLVTKVTELRDTIYQLGEKDRFNSLSQELHKLLIQPALPHIHGKELIIVPHDVLHYLPFQALVASDGRYLIEKCPIYYLSSASLMQFTQEKRRAMGEKVLAFGNPDLGDPAYNLRFAELETKEIQRLYPQATILLEKEATEEKAKAYTPQNDIIHFATHAELNENDPLSSAVLLARSDKEDGRLEVREIFGMDLHASLVVLSACETGLGKLSSGDELVGLTRAFIYAGTPSVVASLWNVEDSSTAALMASFYKNLKTMTKVEALRQAQLQLIRGDGSGVVVASRGIGGVGKLGEAPSSKLPAPISVSTSHPYFWAPFVLVGDGK